MATPATTNNNHNKKERGREREMRRKTEQKKKRQRTTRKCTMNGVCSVNMVHTIEIVKRWNINTKKAVTEIEKESEG